MRNCLNCGRILAYVRALGRERHPPFRRYAYDQQLLLGMIGEVRDAERQGQITGDQLLCMVDALIEIGHRMDALDRVPDSTCLVHSDLSPSNLVWTGTQVVPIDFSLSGYSHHLMDLGSLLAQFTLAEERAAIIDGYETASGHRVDLTSVEPFYAMQVLLFVACQHNQSPRWDWFPETVDRWCSTMFAPLCRRESLLVPA